MARTDPLPQAALEKIATQVGQRLSPVATRLLAEGGTVQMGESFRVYMLGLDAIRGAARPLRTLAKPTGYWHHQIHHGTQAREFARSTSPSPTSADLELAEITTSDAAAKFDDAIAWIDRNVHSDDMTRLLLVPAYYITAFWLSAGAADHVVVAEKPDQVTGLEYHHLYEGPEFLRLLAAIPHAQGVPPQAPR